MTIRESEPDKLENVLVMMARAIMRHEGWHPPGDTGYPRGSRSFRNKNPGNLKAPDGKDADTLPDSDVWPGQTGTDLQGFAVFATLEAGFRALTFQLNLAFTDQSKVYSSKMTLREFFAKYAPDSAGNNSLEYANAVARELGCSIHHTLKNLLEGDLCTKDK